MTETTQVNEAADGQPRLTALRTLVVACRSSVKTDLNAYERLLIAKQKHGEQQTPTYIAAEAEARRLFELLAKIDALALTTPNVELTGSALLRSPG
jgi:hypothetical protein